MKLKKVILLVLFGFVCTVLGEIVLGLIDAYYRRDMVHIRLNTKDYDLDLFFKNSRMLILNKQEEISRRVEGGMEDILIDLMAPPPFQEVFSRINREKLDEKYKIVDDFRKFLEENKKKFKDSKT